MTSTSSRNPHTDAPATPQPTNPHAPPDQPGIIETDAVYHGWPRPDGSIAVIIESPPGTYQPLPHLIVHSPAGFNCGYNGNGPRDLAISLLTHAMKNLHDSGQTAPILYLRFTEEVLALLPKNKAWKLRREDILHWLAER